MGSDAAEFVNKVKDQVRNRQKRMSNVVESGEEHSTKWGMFMATTLNAATFMGKNFSTLQNFINAATFMGKNFSTLQNFINAATFIGKNFSTVQNFVKNF